MNLKIKPQFKDFYKYIGRVPTGSVATYGQIASLAGYPKHARLVGQSLRALAGQDSDLPWHRIVNARGEISTRGLDGSDELQKHLLEAEGVRFDKDERIDMRRFQWRA